MIIITDMNLEDQLLIKRSLKGDEKAIEMLYTRHKQYWFGICLRYASNRFEAHDVFQEAVSSVFEKLNQFKPQKGSFKAWSNRIFVNAAFLYLKKHQWQQSFKDLDLVEDEMDMSESTLGKITAKELTQLIQQLPFGYRVVFNMREIEGYSHYEIAQILGISIGTSKSQLFKAKKALRAKLKFCFNTHFFIRIKKTDTRIKKRNYGC